MWRESFIVNWHENLYYFRALQHINCVYDGAKAWKNQIGKSNPDLLF